MTWLTSRRGRVCPGPPRTRCEQHSHDGGGGKQEFMVNGAKARIWPQCEVEVRLMARHVRRIPVFLVILGTVLASSIAFSSQARPVAAQNVARTHAARSIHA